MFSTIGTDLTYSSMASPLTPAQDFTDLAVSGASFVPTVTAISSSPDLQWMVQSVVSSVAPSESRVHPYSSDMTFSRARMVKTVSGNKAPSTASRRSKIEQLAPEEEEKKRLRRERNKMAAAKCRNRRRELTDTLQAETDKLEDEKSALQNDVANLLKEKERLEFILAAHQPICKISSQMDSTFTKPCVSPASSESAVTSGPSTLTTTTTTSVKLSDLESTLEASLDLLSKSEMDTARSVPDIDLSNSLAVTSGPSTLTTTTTTSVKLSDLESTLEASLDLLSKSEMDTARSVPDIDLSNSLYAAQEWEPLYTPASLDLEPLCTPVVTCTPTCTSYTSSFVFSYPDGDALSGCGQLRRRESGGNEQTAVTSGPSTLTTTTTTSVKLSDLESTLEASLDLLSKSEMDTARSVPDIDLSNSLYAAQEWEPLYTPASLDLEPLCTPVVTCTPTCTSYTSSFVFSYPDGDALSGCGQLRRRESGGNEQTSDSLNSPTLLTL
ncbi:hypothetical protein PGIGA_G00194410 [Pangasianodon gigas]|uniref:Uncharacterized protein n=1 Tax=Pangasianodon gigas TaxID=30993 RepID=A0ACC5XWY8_PANGG|nr:hypothetical protein [Pangasianodon gigas]